MRGEGRRGQGKKREAERKLGEGRNGQGMSGGARRMEGKESEGSKVLQRIKKDNIMFVKTQKFNIKYPYQNYTSL